MKLKSMIGLLLLTGSQEVWSWGERGHHIVGSMGAKSVELFLEPSERASGIASFFSDRSIAIGHAANIPDTSWKNFATKPILTYMNSPNHYFGPERIMGAPPAQEGAAYEEFVKKIHELPRDYVELKKKFDGKVGPLNSDEPDAKIMRLYEDLGTTPYRVEQLMGSLMEAFACAKSKEGTDQPRTSGAYPTLPPSILGTNSSPAIPSYQCNMQLPRKSDLYAAVVIAGTMAHFVGDQSMPYHPTADYDGWTTGNGGIHTYFEALVVQSVDTALENDVMKTLSNPTYHQSIWGNIKSEMARDPKFPWVGALYEMAVNSQISKPKMRKIDDQYAVLEKGTVLKWGQHASQVRGAKAAKRKSSDTKEVLSAFRPLIVERLAYGSVVLGGLFAEAWRRAGRPSVTDVSGISLTYPLDPPFVWPDFDADALARAKAQGRSENLIPAIFLH